MLPRAAIVACAIVVIAFVILSDVHPEWESPVDPGPAPAPTEPAIPWSTATTAVVATDALNVRAQASTDAAVIDTLSQGTRLEVAGPARNGFTPVRHGAGQAWMASEFLTFDRNSRTSDTISSASVDVVPVTEGATVVEERRQALPSRERIDVPEVAAEEPAQERWIDVDRTTGAVSLHEGASIVAVYTGRTGRDPSADGFYSTALGTFHVFSMNKDLAETPFADGVYLTDWVGFDPQRSNGFHSPTRDALGNTQPTQNPTTLGCVRLDADAAAAVFDFAYIGMRVEIHD